MKKKIIFLAASILICALILYNFIFIFRSPKVETGESVLHVGTSADFPPFAYIKDGAIIGFDIDYINEIGKILGKKIIISDLPFFTLIPELAIGGVDLIIGGVTKTPERAKQVDFTEAYMKNVSLVIITLADKDISNLDDLNDKSVIVNDGFVADMFMTDYQKTHKNMTLIRIPAVWDAFIALQKGLAYAFVGAENTVGPFFEMYGKDKFKTYKIPNTSDDAYIAVKKGNQQLLDDLNAAMFKIENNGTLRKLKEKWKFTND